MPKLTPLYKLTPLENKTLKKHLSEAYEKNLIQISKSPYGAAVFFIKKKDGLLQLVVDYWKLNTITVKN